MSKPIQAGSKVLCVNDKDRYGEIRKGDTYEVSSVNDRLRMVWLVGHEHSYDTTRFKAL